MMVVRSRVRYLSTDATCSGLSPSFTQVSSSNLGLSWSGNYLAIDGTSAAVDGGDNGVCSPTDQRGWPRPWDGNGDGTVTCDVGAFEYIPGLASTSMPLVVR